MKPADRIVLFATGALLSRSVLDTLLDSNIIPVAIVLPVYPPALIEKLPGANIEYEAEFDDFASYALKVPIPILYAPAKRRETLPLQISTVKADYILVACWPYLLSTDVTGLAVKAALNIHPSLLPRYRGANPVDDQIAHQERELGVTLHLLNENFDQGDILAQENINFPCRYPEKRDIEIEAGKIGAALFIDAMKNKCSPAWKPVRQPGTRP